MSVDADDFATITEMSDVNMKVPLFETLNVLLNFTELIFYFQLSKMRKL